MLIGGIDNGLNGGIVVLDEHYNIIYKFIMPVLIGKKKEFDVHTITKCFKHLKNKVTKLDKQLLFILEQAHVRPISGKRACFTTGGCYYMMQGILSALDIPYQIVSVNEWQKELLKGLGDDTKIASIKYCQNKWPEEDWTATERSKKAHDGLTDAACMADYGRRLHYGK